MEKGANWKDFLKPSKWKVGIATVLFYLTYFLRYALFAPDLSLYCGTWLVLFPFLLMPGSLLRCLPTTGGMYISPPLFILIQVIQAFYAYLLASFFLLLSRKSGFSEKTFSEKALSPLGKSLIAAVLGGVITPFRRGGIVIHSFSLSVLNITLSAVLASVVAYFLQKLILKDSKVLPIIIGVSLTFFFRIPPLSPVECNCRGVEVGGFCLVGPYKCGYRGIGPPRPPRRLCEDFCWSIRASYNQPCENLSEIRSSNYCQYSYRNKSCYELGVDCTINGTNIGANWSEEGKGCITSCPQEK